MRWPFIILAMFVAAVQFFEDRRKALWILERGRYSHASWADYIAEHPDEPLPDAVSDLDLQIEWVNYYDHIIRLFRLRDSKSSERHTGW